MPKFYTASANIKNNGQKDLLIIALPENSNTVGVFTTNQFIAAPVAIAKKHLSQNNNSKVLLVNSGNANCGNGQHGIDVCLQSCQYVARKFNCSVESILPFSTGVINQELPINLLKSGIDSASKNNSSQLEAAQAIMTTDTQAKLSEKNIQIQGKSIKISGIAKGSGMIEPNMATMLSFVWTDLKIQPQHLEKALKIACDCSFNCISVDGDTSTNDSCTLTATASSGIELEPNHNDWQKWQDALNEIFIELAKSIIKDGEGATKCVAIKVSGGKNYEQCKRVAYTVANSPLVKTALFAEDPNLGRITAAIGRSKQNLDIQKIKIHLNDYLILENIQLPCNYREEKAHQIMKQDEYSINIDLKLGQQSATVWTTDLSYDYIKINAEYRS